ncbi:hypothetical protein [Streptomyces endophytica]|uniref:Chaplin domain-containing protein n=1 Tax=Streptomyces endophytica TaxID=2991496 RepID=A0ABY6PAG5_9ACTN|nr:hypothetical protein [Streptomyces endophytica]UZJ30587.1 hypothetical protein OJ254_09750 [Streptomyces endophytica]
MRRLAQAGTVIGACGLVLLSTNTAQAVTIPGESLLSAAVGADLGTVTGMISGVVCNNRLADFHYKSPRINSPSPQPCINGPVHSGNSVHSGNFINHGNPNHSGNFANTNGSTNSSNLVSGAQQGSGNTVQKILKLHP